MDLARGYRPKAKIKMEEMDRADPLLIIKLPDSRVLRIISRSLFLAVLILTLPSIGSFIRETSSDLSDSGLGLSPSDLIPLVFRDLLEEGLLKDGHKGLVLSSGTADLVENLQFLNERGIDVKCHSGLDSQSPVRNEAFDFVFASSFHSRGFIDRVLKIDGIVSMILVNDPSYEFQPKANFKIVYLRRFDSTVVAMRKIGSDDGIRDRNGKQRRLFSFAEDAKKAALKGLEDVLLEPPRRALAKSHDIKIKFLPDLLGDSLERYPRRIFVTDEKEGVLKWFQENYPSRDQYFDIYNLEVEIDGFEENLVTRAIGASDWLKENVKEEDYVVMKAEAGAVERMMQEKTLSLVDELFLECKNQWDEDGKKRKSKRAYWQCLALYGRLIDEVVAVHQWWGG